MSIEEDASPSSCEVGLGCAGGLSGRRLLHFPLVTQNLGSAAVDLGDPTAINPPYAGLWAPNGCAGNEWTDFARYWMEDMSGTMVTTGVKGATCLAERYGAAPDWAGAACSASYDCSNMGTAPGCADESPVGAPCQYVDITGIAPGTYLLCAEIDYNDRLNETDEFNNVGCTTVLIP